MSKENGYWQPRRGIWEHFADGRMTPLRYTVHQYIISQADTRTGVWRGCAKSIASALCISERVARRALEDLTRLDYLRRFPVPGKHSCYPILIHKFYPLNGEHKGEQLDAISSLSPMDLRYAPIETGEHTGEHLSPQKRLETGDKGLKPAQKPTAPPDSRFQSFYSYAYESYKAKHGRPPIWTAKDRKGLKTLLAGAPAASLPIERLTALWDAFAASLEPFTAKQGDSLAYFCSNLDKFSNCPILAEKRTSNGKANFSDNVSATLAACFGEPKRVN